MIALISFGKIGKFVYKDTASNCIEYSTKKENEFAIFKSDLIKLGYNMTETGKKYGDTFSDYKNAKSKIRLVIPKEIDNKKKYYEIIVYK